jgi:hypothetical protein
MKAKEIEALESYLKTGNEDWNEFALKLLCEVFEYGQFENPEIPMRLVDQGTDIFTDHYEQPVKAVHLFAAELDKHKLNLGQKLFVYKKACEYLRLFEFEGKDLTPVKDLLKCQKEKLEEENQPVKPLVRNIRETLKDLMQKEIETMPETLKGLEPVQRLNILCKLIPFVLPKVESVHPTEGEPV